MSAELRETGNLELRETGTVELLERLGFAAWGDSFTVGNDSTPGHDYVTLVASATSRVAYNGGLGSQTSTQILARVLNDTTHVPWITVIEAGRNNFDQSATVQSDIAAMVVHLGTNTSYLVTSILNGAYPDESIGMTSYNQIIALNAALAVTYGSRYIDPRTALIAAYNPAIGPDVIDHANDVPPFSYRAQVVTGTIVGAISSSDTVFSVSSADPLAAGNILTISSEYVKITGTSGGGANVTDCIRGYGGSVAAGYGAGQAFVATENLHLNDAGYAIWATVVENAISSNGWSNT